MLKYVYNEYCDRRGTGEEKIFDTEQEAVNYAWERWSYLTTSERKEYFKPGASMFVVSLEITDEQLENYNDGWGYDGEGGLLEDLWVKDIVNIPEAWKEEEERREAEREAEEAILWADDEEE